MKNIYSWLLIRFHSMTQFIALIHTAFICPCILPVTITWLSSSLPCTYQIFLFCLYIYVCVPNTLKPLPRLFIPTRCSPFTAGAQKVMAILNHADVVFQSSFGRSNPLLNSPTHSIQESWSSVLKRKTSQYPSPHSRRVLWYYMGRVDSCEFIALVDGVHIEVL